MKKHDSNLSPYCPFLERYLRILKLNELLLKKWQEHPIYIYN
jgi:hypothetical protein